MPHSNLTEDNVSVLKEDVVSPSTRRISVGLEKIEESNPTEDSASVLVSPSNRRISVGADTSLFEEHTLTAFGDISLSEIDFVPGLASALTPVRKTRRSEPENRLIPTRVRKVAKRSLRKPELSFDGLVEEHKKAREETLPAANLDANLLADMKNIGAEAVIAMAVGSHEGVQNSARPKPTVTAKPEDENKATPIIVGIIKGSKKNGLRGNAKLPKRPPLPRSWTSDGDDAREIVRVGNERRKLELAGHLYLT